jgi:hypothetical protein
MVIDLITNISCIELEPYLGDIDILPNFMKILPERSIINTHKMMQDCNEKKLLTIAIPVYRRYNSLSKLLKQIEGQISKENLAEYIEVLICDDSGSEKQNFEFISPYLSKKYFRYIDNRENIGIINNILKVIEESSGKYCLSPGDDEELLDGKLVECIAILKEMPDDIVAIIFDEKISDIHLVLNCLEAAEKYFWYFGNLGCFIVNTDTVKKYFSCNKRNTIWPQTELVFHAAYEEKTNFFIVKNRIICSPNHRKNTRYNSYYLLEGGFLSLIRTALNLEDNDLQYAAIKNINTRDKKLLILLLLHYVFNDTKHDTKKTRIAISECHRKYKRHIFDKSIYFFNFLSLIPKIVYILLLKIFRKYTKIKKMIKNENDKEPKFNDNYT